MTDEHTSGPVAIAVASSLAEAEFLKSVLAAHDIDAGSSAAETAYPSVDFVQGVTVTVAADQAEEAREILAGLEQEPE